MIRFATYNMLNMYLDPGDPDEAARYERVLRVIRDLDADILALQELRGTPGQAADRLVELAKAVGMTTYHRERHWDERGGENLLDKIAMARSGAGFHPALIWNPDTVAPVPGTFRAYEGGEFFHAVIKGVFAVQGSDGATHEVQHASFHAGPFGNSSGQRAGECERVVSALTRPDDRPPGLVAADWNTVCADRLADGSYYDQDPYADQPWHGDFVYQCRWDYDDHGRRISWRANREPGDVLYSGGLHDAAVVLHNARIDDGGLPWQTTVGHWPVGDPFGERRIDGVRVTAEVRPALRDYEVVRTELTLSASDHLPVVISYDPAAIDYAVVQARRG